MIGLKYNERHIIKEIYKDVYVIDNFLSVDETNVLINAVNTGKYTITINQSTDPTNIKNFPEKFWKPILRLSLEDNNIKAINTLINSMFTHDIDIFRTRISVSFIHKYKPSKLDFHVDGKEYINTIRHNISKVIVFYLNTNNGYTEFENKEIGKVDSVINRALIFPISLKHRAVGQTDKAERIVMNINYTPWV